jgi:type IV secretory pathway TrbD component
VRNDRPRPTFTFILGGFVNVGLGIATIVLVIGEESGMAVLTGLLAAITGFALARWSTRGGFR